MAAFTFAPLVNSAQTTITQAMTPTDPANGGTLAVADGSVFPAKGYAQVDNELFHFDSRAGNNLTLNATDGRASGGSTAAPHLLGSAIYADVRVAAHLNEVAESSPNTLLTAKGDLLVATGAYTPARLAVGPEGSVLAAKASEASGLWYVAERPLELIADTQVSVPVASIDFSGIPATYKHLVVHLTIFSTGNSFAYLRVNNDSGANYDHMRAEVYYGLSGFFTYNYPGDVWCAVGNAAYTARQEVKILIPNYANTSAFKNILSREDYWIVGIIAYRVFEGVWKSAAAINRLTFSVDGVQFDVGARATLYGMV